MTPLLYIPEFFGVSIEVYLILIILGIPVFFVWRRIFKNRNMQVRSRRTIVWLVTIITTPLLYGGLAMLLIFIMEYYPKQDFNKKEWLNKNKRYEYSDDIIDSKMLINKSKNEVRKILGDESNLDTSDTWYYDLGFRPELLNIDPYSLEVDFNNGKVVKVEQHTMN